MAIPAKERRLPLYNLTKRLATFILWPLFKIRANGHFNIPKEGPFVILPKHQRWEDVPLISISIARPVYYMAKYELFINPLSRWLLSSLGGLPLNRSNPSDSISSVKKLFNLLEKGEGIVVFPEGTYYKKRVGRLHRGLIRMILARYKVPLIPVGITYSRPGQRILANIEIGRPVYTKASDDIDQSINLAFNEMARLSGLKNYIGEDSDDGT